MMCPICGKDHLNHFGTPGPVVTIGTNADKTYTAADIAAAEERGRREAVKELRERARLLKAGDEFWNAKHAVYILPDSLLDAKGAEDGR